MILPFDCRLARERLAHQAAGAESGAEVAALEAHLAACASCRGEADDIRGAVAAIREADVPDPGPTYWGSFSSRVRAGIAAEAEGKTSAARGWAGAGGVAAAALILFVWIGPGNRQVAILEPEAPPAADSRPTPDLEVTLDTLLGGEDVLTVSEPMQTLTSEERRVLLETLRAEIEESA